MRRERDDEEHGEQRQRWGVDDREAIGDLAPHEAANGDPEGHADDEPDDRPAGSPAT